MKRPFVRGPTTPGLGDLRSPWLLTTYKSWDDPPTHGAWVPHPTFEVCPHLPCEVVEGEGTEDGAWGFPVVFFCFGHRTSDGKASYIGIVMFF